MNKFLKDLEKELQRLNVSPKEIKEILEDHKEMMEAAKEEGLNEDELRLKFGEPSKVATEIYSDLNSLSSEINLDEVESIVNYDLDKYTFVETFTAISDIKEFEISLVNDNFIMTYYEGESIQVYQKNIKELDKYEIGFSSNKFTLKRKSNKKLFGNIYTNNNGAGFLVLFPKELKAEGFKYNTISGDFELNGLTVDKFNHKSTNGDIEISNVNLGEAKFSLVNGDIEMNGFKAISFDISLVNGDVELQNGILENNLYINSVSGDVDRKSVV